VTRALKALGAVAVVVALVVLGARALTTNDDHGKPAASSTPKARTTVPPTPADAPSEGMYVVSNITVDGSVDVETWVHAPQPISQLKMTTSDPDLLPGSVESLDLIVRTMDGKVVAHRDSVGTNHQTIRLRAPATELYFSYTVDGGMDDATSTVPGRRLARVLAMDVDYEGAASGVVRRLVTAPGTVLNVACLRPRSGFQASPRACGKAVGDGDWQVELSGPDRGDRLLAQVEE
jgi:hypothetical protein